MTEMKHKIVLIGGGGHCKSVVNTIYRSGNYDDMVITDPAAGQIKSVLGIPVVGDDSALPELRERGYHAAFITVGSIKSTALRRLLYEKAVRLGFYIPCIVDPSAQVSGYARLEEGVFVGQNAVINAEAHIGKLAIVNTGAIIEHECQIGEFSHVAVGAKLCGGVSVGSDSLIGAGAVVIQGVHIGSGALVGVGSVVLKNIEDGKRRLD